MDDIMEKLPDPFNMIEIMGKVEERTPYVVVAFQVYVTKMCTPSKSMSLSPYLIIHAIEDLRNARPGLNADDR